MEGRKGNGASETEEDKSIPAERESVVDGRWYYLKLEGGIRYEDLQAGNLARRVYVIRLQDVHMLLEDEGKRIKGIQKDSNATVAVISYPDGRLYDFARLELWGSEDQVNSAAELIVKVITKVYAVGRVPTILMEASFINTVAYVIPGQVCDLLLGIGFDKLMDIEVTSGAWIMMDRVETPRAMTRLKIFGSRLHIFHVLSMLHAVELKVYAAAETGDEKESAHSIEYITSACVVHKAKEMEAKTGAQIQVDTFNDPIEPLLMMTRLNISGVSAEQIKLVLSMVHEIVLGPYLPGDQDFVMKEAKPQGDVKEVAQAQVHASAKPTKYPGICFFMKFGGGTEGSSIESTAPEP